MAKTGDVIENPTTGERITFLKTTRETNGELLRFEYSLPPGPRSLAAADHRAPGKS